MVNQETALLIYGGDAAAAIAQIDVCIASIPRPGQPPAEAAAEKARLEALKAQLEALPA